MTAPASARTYYRYCSPVSGEVEILAHGTSCPQAHRVIQKVYVKGQEYHGSSGILHAIGWSCSLSYPQGDQTTRPITCRRGSKMIKAGMP
jgi:hypothetical protein